MCLIRYEIRGKGKEGERITGPKGKPVQTVVKTYRFVIPDCSYNLGVNSCTSMIIVQIYLFLSTLTVSSFLFILAAIHID